VYVAHKPEVSDLGLDLAQISDVGRIAGTNLAANHQEPWAASWRVLLYQVSQSEQKCLYTFPCVDETEVAEKQVVLSYS
jgi:hypothetical protein